MINTWKYEQRLLLVFIQRTWVPFSVSYNQTIDICKLLLDHLQ